MEKHDKSGPVIMKAVQSMSIVYSLAFSIRPRTVAFGTYGTPILTPMAFTPVLTACGCFHCHKNILTPMSFTPVLTACGCFHCHKNILTPMSFTPVLTACGCFHCHKNILTPMAFTPVSTACGMWMFSLPQKPLTLTLTLTGLKHFMDQDESM